MAANATLDEAIEGAVNAQKPPAAESPVQEETQQETAVEETPQQDPRIRAALEVYEALQNPQKARSIIADMAKQVGLIKEETGQSERKVVKKFAERFLEKLPEAERGLFSSLGPALEAAIAEEREEIRNENLDRHNQLVWQNAERDGIEAYAIFESRHPEIKGNIKLEEALVDNMKKLPYNGQAYNNNLVAYMEDIYKITNVDGAVSSKVQKTVDKMVKNAQAAETPSVDASDTRIRGGSKLPSLDEALRAGVQGKRL